MRPLFEAGRSCRSSRFRVGVHHRFGLRIQSKWQELTEDEMSVSVFDGEAIDVDEIVKEQILLAVPDSHALPRRLQRHLSGMRHRSEYGRVQLRYK